MATSSATARASALDWVTLGAAAGLLSAGVAFRVGLWPSVAALAPHAPDAFVAAFAQHTERTRIVVLPLGMLTMILTVIALVREGGLASRRGKLRGGAVAALFALAITSTVGIEPLEESIIAAIEGSASAFHPGVTPLLSRWLTWQWINLLAVAVIGAALVLAHRAPLPVADDTADGLTARHRTLLFLLGAATLFEGYDRFIVTLALPYIGKDLGASEGQLGWALSAIRVGALLSVLLGRAADRHGRRRLLLITVLSYTLATAATGLSRGLLEFVIFQLIATVFLVTELALAQVVIAEEFPAAWRGRGQGQLGAFAALGGGVVAILFPILQKTALGWRGLYFIGLLPLLLIAYLRRALPETTRWQQEKQRAHAVHVRFADLARPPYGRRFFALLAMAFCVSAMGAPAGQFLSYRATNTFGWTPAQVITMIVVGGGIGFWGWFIVGRIADVIGRRLTGACAFIGAALAAAAYYQTSYLYPAIAALVFTEAGTAIALNSLGTELFPTRLRASAKSWITNAGIVGAMAGLAAVGAFADQFGGVETVIPVLALLPVVVAPVLFVLPETRGRQLEVIAGEEG
jgi:putative MFS transporter